MGRVSDPPVKMMKLLPGVGSSGVVGVLSAFGLLLATPGIPGPRPGPVVTDPSVSLESTAADAPSALALARLALERFDR